MSLLLTVSLIGLSLAPSDVGRLAEAEYHFAMGVQARNDADTARAHFADAARAYDDLWNFGIRNPSLAKNRARSHRLAGSMAAAIAALQEGLAIARYDRGLQVELEEARAAVAYPHDDLADACRPEPLRGIATRMSPLEAYLIAAGLWFAACLGLTRFVMTRVPGWLIASGIAIASLAVLGALWWQDASRRSAESTRPLIVVKHESPLKTGNGDSWPDRLKWKLPPGAEVRELARRGGWVQVELASGVAGWIPEEATLLPSVQ